MTLVDSNASPKANDGPPGTGKVVLVVDDDPTICKWLTRLLEILDYTVLATDDSSAAEAILGDSHVDAVILDLRLGEERSGLDVLEFIRGRSELAKLPVVLLTGIARMTEDEQASIRRHGAHLFHKPASVSELHATLARAFAG